MTDQAAPTVSVPAASATGDPAEDAYLTGYGLWTEKRYADAETTLADLARRYPKHKRASYARYMLGRAQLDEGLPAVAAQTFLANYKTDPHGGRAPDSLFYLGQALTQLKQTGNACSAYGSLAAAYGTTISTTIRSRLPAARKAAGCN